MSYARAENNQNNQSLLMALYSKLHINNSIFEKNLNNRLLYCGASLLNINLCTFRDNNAKSTIIFSNDSPPTDDFTGYVLVDQVTLINNHGAVMEDSNNVLTNISNNHGTVVEDSNNMLTNISNNHGGVMTAIIS